MKVIVLGATGMLGSMVYASFKDSDQFSVIGTARKRAEGLMQLDAYDDPDELGKKLKGCDYVINCIGITKPYCHDDNMTEVHNAVIVNALFPQRLNEVAQKHNFKVIQIATDCVYSGKQGQYAEDALHDALDVYGKTKSLGEVRSKAYLNIRSSIIGPEPHHQAFLLEWFLKQPAGSTLNGFSHHLWNGVTTLQFAQLCMAIVREDKFPFLNEIASVHHFVPNETVTKYQLLCMFKEVFEKDFTIKEQQGGSSVVDRTLKTKHGAIATFFPGSDLRSELTKLKPFVTTRNP